MVERCDGAGLALEAAAKISAGRSIFSKDFDGNIAVHAGIAGAVDLTHTADSERGLNLVGAQPCIRGHWHSFSSPCIADFGA
jgi:hypothetical protein